MQHLLLAFALSLISFPAFTCTEDGREGIVEENDLKIFATEKAMSKSNVDEAEFNRVIDEISAIYEPIIDGMGANLVVNRNWEDGTVNAYANRSGRTWNIHMFGGLARHETITSDGFALVVCHEIGHHIGGAPKKRSFFSSWASNEGQADYWATLKCLRKYFQTQDNASIVSNLNVPQEVVDVCSAQFSTAEDQLICQRGSMAGMSTALLFQALRREPTAPLFTTPDANVVDRTDHDHPATQCRLDTYYTGAICNVLETDDVSQNDEKVGTCNRSEDDEIGVRPLCWFKPGQRRGWF